MDEPWRTILTVAAGFGTGVLSGMFGVGGAVISTPAIRALGATAIEAVGTTLPSVLPSALSGTLRYRREGFIRYRVVRWTGATGAVASVAGSRLSHTVPGNGHVLMLATAALMFFTAGRLARARDIADDRDRALDRAPRDTTPVLVGIGLVAGGLSGLLGVGGGVLMVPAFSEVLALPIKEAVGTSLACVGIFAVPGTITHSLLHDINWSIAIALSIAVIPGARVGSRLAIRATERSLQLTVAVGLGLTSVVYAVGEAVALMR